MLGKEISCHRCDRNGNSSEQLHLHFGTVGTRCHFVCVRVVNLNMTRKRKVILWRTTWYEEYGE